MRYKLRIKKDKRTIIRGLVVFVIVIATVFLANGPYLTYAASTIDTSTSSTATSNDSQRRTFFDTVNDRHWSLYYNGSAIEYSYSSDGTNWTSAGTLSYNTTDFSVTYKEISSTGYVYLASQCDGYDICVYKGTLSNTNISWGSVYKPFDGSSASATYDKAAVNLTSNNNVVIAARYYNGTTYQAYARTSTTANDPSTWDTALTVGATNASLKNLVLMPNGTNLHLLLNSKDSKLTVFRHTGSAWAEENDGASGGWMTYGQPSGASAAVYAITVDSQNNVYAGGSFTTIGGVSANRIAKFDGNSWSAMGTGTTQTVYSLAVDSQDNLYAGGYGTFGGVSNTNYIAKWNGTAWSAMGTGANSYVYALAVDSSDNVYAGGDFTTIGGASIYRIAKWDGSSWSAMGTGTGTGAAVRALAVDSLDNIYAGGEFTTIGGSTIYRIAKWNGSGWSAMGTTTGTNSTVSTLAIDSLDNVYAGGGFTTIGGVSANYSAKWDGSAWSAMGTGAGNAVYSIAIDGNDDMYVGGNFTTLGGITINYIGKWSGSAWSAMGTGANNTINALAVDSSDNIYAGGVFTSIGGVSASYIAMWNGSSWSAMGTGASGGQVMSLVVDSSDNIYAGGAFSSMGGVSNTACIAKWDGSSWSAMGTGGTGSVSALAVDSQNNVYAGGNYTTIGGISANYIAMWNGSAWSAMGTGADANINAVIVDSADNVYAGGAFTSMGGVSNTAYIAKWDGSAWSSTGGTGANNNVYALAVDSNDNIYAGGYFTIIGGTSAVRIAKWNGTSWSAMGTGANNTVFAITIDSQNNIYAGGNFTTIGSVTINRIAKWDGSNWSAMGSGAGAVIQTLSVDSNNCVYAGGSFTDIGSVGANRIAKWDGSDWSATEWGVMGQGANASIYAMAIDSKGRLYIGGTFTSVGGVTASRLAMWDGYKWNAMGTGITTGTSPYVYSLAIDSNDNVYVGGYFTAIGGVTTTGIAKWNGSSWSAMGTGAGNQYVQAVAIDSNDNIYAGGAFTAMGGVSNTAYIAMWNGTAWISIGGTGASAYVDAFAIDGDDNVYAGGNFTTIGGVSATRVAVYDGSTWTALGTGANNSVMALALDSSNNLYAGGSFTSIGGITTNSIAIWNGSSWSAMGTGATGSGPTVLSVGVDSNDNVYTGGTFVSMSGVTSTQYFARWDGSAWNSMVTEGASYTRAVVVDSADNIYIGGDMTTINSISTGYMAKYSYGNSSIDSTSPWSAYTRADKIYALFNSSSQLHLATYDTTYRRWVNNITLQSSATNIDSLSLSATDDTMYAFYTESGAVKYYNTTGSNFHLLSNWDATPTSAYSTGTNDNVSAANTTSTDTFIGYAWTNGTSSPYDVMYDYVGDLPAPTEYTWTGLGDGTSWDDGDNWDAGGTFYPNSAAHTVTINTGSATITTPSGAGLTVGQLTLGSSFTGNLSLGNSLTVDNASALSGNLSISSGATLTTNGNDITVDGTFTSSGSFVADGSETFNFSLPTTAGTAVYTGFTGSLTLPQSEYYNLAIDSSSGTVVTPATTTINGALTLTNGTLDLQTNSTDLTVKTGLTVSSGSVTTGSGTSYFLGDFHYADNSHEANFGNIEIGASPDTIDLDTDMICSSLTINSGDILNTNGYDIDCSGGISIASTGLLDATDDVETDTTQINLGGNWSNDGTFTASDSTVTFDGTSTQSITSGTSDFYNLTTTNASVSGLTFADGSGVAGTFTNTTPSSTITFNATSTYDFANINIAGTSGNEIVLQSSSGSSQWFLNVTQSYPSADYVNVQDSDANGGNEIDASTGGINSGNNENWDFTGDSEAPVINITSHYNNQFVSGNITVSGTASDNDQLDLVETKMDSESYVSASGTTSWSQAVDTTTYSNGEHTFYARATDGHGNTAVAQVILNIQNGVSYGTTETSDSINVNVTITSGISLACDPTVSMNDITGTGRSDLSSNDNNRATCTVVTNNSNGYNLTWKSASTGTMTNASSDSIAQYTPSSSGVAEPWSVAATASEWGAHLGYGSTTRDSDFWGTGTDARPAYATGYNWLNVSTTDFSIAQRATETSASGDTEYLWFGAEIGASSWQPTGTYTQTVTLTASTL